jgi:hypothetical protein
VADNPFSGMTKGECQVCHKKVDGRSYYCEEHKPPKRSRKKEREVEPITISVSTPKRSRKGPSADTYWDTFGGAIVLILNYLLLKPLDNIPDSEALQEKFMISKDEAETLTRPLLRIFSQTSLSRSKGRMIIENADVIPALVVALSIIGKMKIIRGIVETNQSGSTSETIQANNNVGRNFGGFGPVFVEDIEDLERTKSKTD